MSLSESGDESGSWSGSGSGRVWGLTTTTHSDIRGPRRHHGTDDTTGTDRHPRRHHGTDDTTGTDRHRDGEASPPTADRRPSSLKVWGEGLRGSLGWSLGGEGIGAHGRTDGRKGHRDGEASPTAGLHSFIINGVGGGSGRDTGTGRLHRPPASTHHSAFIIKGLRDLVLDKLSKIIKGLRDLVLRDTGTGRLHRPPASTHS